jgi:type II secretory pathway component PulC
LEQLDLRPGDIVRTIEGRRMKSADAAWQSLDDAISTGTPIVVGIERDGAMMSIFIDGSRLASTSVPQSHPPPGT